MRERGDCMKKRINVTLHRSSTTCTNNSHMIHNNPNGKSRQTDEKIQLSNVAPIVTAGACSRDRRT